MAEKQIKVSRRRTGEYIVNYDLNGRIIPYRWAGAKGNKIDTKAIPQHVVDWLIMDTSTFTDGDLVIEETPKTKDVINSIDGVEEYKQNIHTREEIINILEGNTNTMKAELNKITKKEEKEFVVEVAQEIKLDSSAKRKFLSEWIKVPQEMIFSEEE